MTPPCVLVVDDDADLREIMAIALTTHGYRVVTAVSGAECLRRLRTDVRPHLILLDMMMPDVNGWEVCEALAQDPELADIPVVVLTGNVQISSDQVRARLMLRKPVELAVLLAAVARFARNADAGAP